MTHSCDTIDRHLIDASLRPSPVRRMTLKLLQESTTPISALDIEVALETVDRSSISRTLSAFVNAALVHVIDDGSGSTKYEICHHHGNHSDHTDIHPHFHCTECGRTICLTDIPLADVTLPDGYLPLSTNYVIKGLCPRCSSKVR